MKASSDIDCIFILESTSHFFHLTLPIFALKLSSFSVTPHEQLYLCKDI